MARVFKNDRSIIGMERIRVAMLCTFSNSVVRERIPPRINIIEFFLRYITRRSATNMFVDKAQWNTNAINELKKRSEIELHVVFDWKRMPKDIISFQNEGVHYHAFKDENTTFFNMLRRIIRGKKYHNFSQQNTKRILRIIEEIRPDIVHLIGAENPRYSEAVLELDSRYPLIVTLQTLMLEPEFIERYPIEEYEYIYRSSIEKAVLKRANYITSGVPRYIDYIKNNIDTKAKLLDTIDLALAEEAKPFDVAKEYDFVYFASDIEKAFDLVIDAVNIVRHKYPILRVNVSGGYNVEYKASVDMRLSDLGCSSCFFFTGLQDNHENVLRQICKSRFALLPLKADFISGTIRESFSMGLPVITTVTEGTPTLNEKRVTVLLSEIGDSKALADNMIELMSNSKLAEELRHNGFLYMKENYPSNNQRIDKWVIEYKNIVNR